MSADEAEEVLAEDFKDHTDMSAIWTAMAKMVEESDDMTTTRMKRVRRYDTLKEFNFIESRLCVSRSGLDDL